MTLEAGVSLGSHGTGIPVAGMGDDQRQWALAVGGPHRRQVAVHILLQHGGLGRGFLQAGGEWRSPQAFWSGRVRPIAGLDLQFREVNDWRTDLSLRAGLQFEGVSVLSRNLQLLLEYFNGRSFDGQFYRVPVEYVGVGAHFNF